jgi:hypothetical protein
MSNRDGSDTVMSVIHGFFEERSQPNRVPLRVDAISVLDLEGNPIFADGHHEVHFRFRSSLRKMSQVKVRKPAQKIPGDALRKMAGQVGQVRRGLDRLRVQRDRLLKPTRPQSVVTQADLVVALSSFESQFQRVDQLEKHRPVQEFQVGQNSRPSDVAPQGLLDLGRVNRAAGRLAGITARQAVHFLQQLRISLCAFHAYAKIMLNGPLNDVLIELVGHFRPRDFASGLSQRIPASLRKCGERPVPNAAVGVPESPQCFPKLFPQEGLQPVLREVRGNVLVEP